MAQQYYLGTDDVWELVQSPSGAAPQLHIRGPWNDGFTVPVGETVIIRWAERVFPDVNPTSDTKQVTVSRWNGNRHERVYVQKAQLDELVKYAAKFL
jgi:hypothetical protein